MSDVRLSNVAKVTLGSGSGMISIYPNPVGAEGVATVQFNDLTAGDYNLQLVNEKGQLVKQVQLNHPGGNAVYPLVFENNLSKGTYFVRLLVGRKVKTTVKVVY